jgi:hypothetical protein
LDIQEAIDLGQLGGVPVDDVAAISEWATANV